jgi:hypothetical protein
MEVFVNQKREKEHRKDDPLCSCAFSLFCLTKTSESVKMSQYFHVIFYLCLSSGNLFIFSLRVIQFYCNCCIISTLLFRMVN